MVFSSLFFLFLFLPVFFIFYYLLRSINSKLLFVLLASLLFYFFGEGYLVWIVIASTLIDYCCALVIDRDFNFRFNVDGTRTSNQKIALFISILANLSFLIYFKYSNFFVHNILSLATHFSIGLPLFKNFIEVSLPLGISFYTFQSMSYTIDVYNRKVQATSNFVKFSSYVVMFPQLVAGPIVRYIDIEHQLSRLNLTSENIVEGIKRFILGLSKKVIIANTLAFVADEIFSSPIEELNMASAWLGIVCYTLQIYFDFSGYSCMAIGLGKMMGLTFPENFNYPYTSKSIKEFWRRWHITLSSWFRDYLYIPLGGSRVSTLKTYRNLMIVFLLCGFWHGASWTFIIWGGFHGLFLVIERLGLGNILPKLGSIFSNIYTLLVVMIGWVFFRADNLVYSFNFIKTMFGMNTSESSIDIYRFLDNKTILILILGILFSTSLMEKLKDFIKKGLLLNYQLLSSIVLLFLLGICVLLLASGTNNPFLYFRF